MSPITFDKLPEQVASLRQDVLELKGLIQNRSTPTKEEPEAPISVTELEKLTGYTKPTIYAKCRNNEMPHCKMGNRLYFFRSEIITWIKSGRQMTNDQLDQAASQYFQK